MKKTLFFLLVVLCWGSVLSQDFFDTEFNRRKKYIVLTNPTVGSLKTAQYLVKAGLLDVNTRKIKFVGVYHKNQKYDFNQAINFIKENDISYMFMHQVEGELNAENLFKHNECSDELKNIFENSIGAFFFGGPDIPPAVYGEENTGSVVTNPVRHYFETTFLFHLLGSYRNNNFNAYMHKNPLYLVTGFCLGMQTMVVATGGDLIQDIPDEIYGASTPESTLKIGRANLHRNYWQKIEDDSLLMGINLHTIQFTEHPFFGDIVKIPKRWQPRVCSSHHQAADKLGKGLEITALSPDGKVVEAIAHNIFPNVFAVQFHPEVPALYEDMYKRKFHPEDEPMTYHDIIGRQSVKFHEKYWQHISDVLRKAKRKRKK